MNCLESNERLPLMELPVVVQDIQNMCRLCMSSTENSPELEMVDISSNHPITNTPISQLFIEGLNININDESSDGMPNKVCVNCLAELLSYFKFKRRSLSIDAKLRLLVRWKQKIAEAQALYGPAVLNLETTSQFSEETSHSSLHFEPMKPDLNKATSDMSNSYIAFGGETEEGQVPMEGETSTYKDSEANSHRSCLQEESVNSGHASILSHNVPGRLDSNRNHECDATVQEASMNIINEVVCAHVEQDNCSSDVQIHKIIGSDDFCSDVVGEVVITDNHEDFSHLDFHQLSSSIIAQDDSYTPDNISPEVDCQTDVNINSNSLLGSDLPKNVKRVRAVCKKFLEVDSATLRKKKRRKDSIPVPEVLVVEDASSGKHLAYRCPLCKKVFNSRNLFAKHSSVHVKGKGLVCKYCDKWFRTQSFLTRHERVHSGEKPFKCALCERHFSQREILQRHILTHTDTKPFQCQHCDKSYTQKEALNNHINNYHSKERVIAQYPCPVCPKAFCHPSGLSRHMGSHTGRLFSCKVCSRSFADSSSLRRHIKSQHVGHQL